MNQEDKEKKLQALQWALAEKVLYEQDDEYQLDPNNAADSAAFNALQKQQAENLERFVAGPGKVVFDMWRKEIRVFNLQLLTSNESDKCTCDTCLKLRGIKMKLLAMHDILLAIEMQKMKEKAK